MDTDVWHLGGKTMFCLFDAMGSWGFSHVNSHTVHKHNIHAEVERTSGAQQQPEGRNHIIVYVYM